MPTTTSQRRSGMQGVRTSEYTGNMAYNRYAASAVKEYNYTMPYPRHNTQKAAAPKTKTAAKPAVSASHRKLTFKVFLRVACVFVMCCIMLYRYAVILESNDKIAKLNKELIAAESNKQAVQAKIDKGLELGNLENYAKTQLGMVYPDNYQIFYIDMQLGDGAQMNVRDEQKKSELALKGTPGALVHAIQVLK